MNYLYFSNIALLKRGQTVCSQTVRSPLRGALMIVASLIAGANIIFSEEGSASEHDVELILGGQLISFPEFSGAQDVETIALPLVDLTYKEKFYINTTLGTMGVYLVKTDQIEAEIGLTAVFGRDESDAARLSGLGDIDGGAAFRVAGAVTTSIGQFYADARHQITGDETGTTLELGVRYLFELAEGLYIAPSAKFTVADDTYREAFFSINSAQVQASTLTAYKSDNAVISGGVGVYALYEVANRWVLYGNIDYQTLSDDAADSPVVEDRDQVDFMLGVGRRF